ncbi:peptidoglycan DD-metalloendopeptidase family protein [Nannocystis bainbridge]|uniref:Peptidoglycan DD-metalloendopeptidase family protein n=1 Tax=Nannocystis bainbridge TaxID=2995303 RepID=A0ABT5DRG7_9BACT|nr:peptidoglycan DD-metalloendopeptidase family protein [Nannocystis bainbridge]MDC0715723.1 peptidoglycan DD-metalloendopeptidase family protein [Nannocystis bainbridge]
MTRLASVFAHRNLFSLALAGTLSVALGGCIEDMTAEEAELDPAGFFGDEEWWDAGPPAGEEAAEFDALEDLAAQTEVSLAPAFQLPFPCGQVWAGQTRTNHSPVNSVDFNRTDDVNDPVVAAAAGKVSRVANEGATSYGKWVEIDHGGGYRTRYAHLNSQSVTVGQSVSQGQKIGTVGSTGGSSGPHLHYEQRLNGTAQKPVFNGSTALFFGTKNYTSKNKCSGGGSGGVTGTVSTSGLPLTVRSTPSTSGTAVGSVANGAKVTITCQKNGTSVTGTFGTTKLWDFIGTGYVSDAYINTGSDGQVAPTCN